MLDHREAAACEGVHLGQSDLHPADARRLLGDHAIVGLTLKTGAQADELYRLPVDYACIGGVFAFCEVNLTLANRFRVFGREDQVEVAVDLLNAFDNRNFSGFDGFFSATDPLDPPRIGTNLLTLPRRVQFRLGYRF